MFRFVAVWYPLKSLTLCSARRACIITCIMFSILSGYNSHIFWTMHLRHSKKGRVHCAPHPDDKFMMDYYPWLKLTTYSCLPFVIVLVLNVCIIIKIIPGFKMVTTRSSTGGTTSAVSDGGGRHSGTAHKDSKVTTITHSTSGAPCG